MFKLSGKLEISSYFDQLSANIGKIMVDFLCNECGKCFEQGVNLAVHQIRTYDKRSFTCEKCGEASVGKSTYNNHMRKHTNAVAKPKALRNVISAHIIIIALDLNIYSHRKHLKPISSCFLFKNIQVCTGCEQLFRERTIKPISSYFLSHEYSGLYWI